MPVGAVAICQQFCTRLASAGYNGQAFDLASSIGLQKCVVIFKRYASVRIAVRAKHVCVRKETCPAVKLTIANRYEAQRWDAVEKLLPRLKLIDIGRGRTMHPLIDMARVV